MTVTQIIAEGRMNDLRPSDFPLVFDAPFVARCGCDSTECEAPDCEHLGYLVYVADTPHNLERYPGRQS